MVLYLNHVAVAAPRNGTTTHTVDPAGGVVANGASFTPTAGRLLICVVEGPVTSTTPAGWTLPTNGSAVANSGLYVFTKTAAGADTLATTHNGSNCPIVCDFYEYPAGSTFVSSATATGVAKAGGAGPTLSGLTGTNDVFAPGARNIGSTAGADTVTWSNGVEIVDTQVVFATTDGYTYSITYREALAAASSSSAATFSNSTATTAERLVFAVLVAGGAPALPPIIVMPPRRR